MKKYIVYDDKVYEIKVNEEYKKEGVVNYYYIQTSPNVRLLLEKEDIKQCKQADTIEELIEEFVFEGVDDKPVLCSYEELIYWFNYSKKQQYKVRNCYGATWTKKGLIYIAKLNDKKELELI